MTARRSVDVPGFQHANPIPVASRIGTLLATGVLTGRDTQSGQMPASLSDQCANVFCHVRATLSAVGGSVEDIIKMTFWLADPRDREALNKQWLLMFPDPASRPARQVMAAILDNGCRIQCDLWAVLNAADHNPTG